MAGRQHSHSVEEFEERVTRYENNLRERLAREKDYEVAKLRDILVAEVRLEEKEKYHRLLEEYRQGQDRIFQQRKDKIKLEIREQQLSLTALADEIRHKEERVGEFLKREKELLAMKEDDLRRSEKEQGKFLESERERMRVLEMRASQAIREAEHKEQTLQHRVEAEAEYKVRAALAEAKRKETTLFEKEREVEEKWYKLKNAESLSETFREEIHRLQEENGVLRQDVESLRQNEMAMGQQLAQAISSICQTEQRRTEFGKQFAALSQ